MTELLHDLVRKARSYSSTSSAAATAANSLTRRESNGRVGYGKLIFYRRQLYRCEKADGSVTIILTLGLSDGFRVLEVFEENVVQIVSHDENGPVSVVAPLQQPYGNGNAAQHPSGLRFLVTSGNNRSKFPNTCIKIFSVADENYVHVMRLSSPVLDVEVCQRSNVFVASLQGELQLFSAKDYSFLFTVSCFPSPRLDQTCSLGPCWLAFAGGVPSFSPESGNFGVRTSTFSELGKDYRATISSLTKDVMSGLYSLGNMGGKKIANYLSNSDSEKSDTKSPLSSRHIEGSVTIFDVPTRKTLCVFKAHAAAIAHVSFDVSGSLLVTADSEGQYLHVWNLLNPKNNPSSGFQPCVPCLVHKIFRGITHANICSTSFSPDFRFVAITSRHGTAHLYSLEPHCIRADNPPSSRCAPQSCDIYTSNPKQKKTLKSEHIKTVNPFHRIHHPTSARNDQEPAPLVTALHMFSRTGDPILIGVTASQHIFMYRVHTTLPIRGHLTSASKELRTNGNFAEPENCQSEAINDVLGISVKVERVWDFLEILHESHIDTSATILSGTTPSKETGNMNPNGASKRQSLREGKADSQSEVVRRSQTSRNGLRRSSSRISGSTRQSPNQQSVWLSNVEMITFKSNEVPFWASPQFELYNLSENKSVSQVKSEAIGDSLFWEDQTFEPFKYRKHAAFSGLRIPEIELGSSRLRANKLPPPTLKSFKRGGASFSSSKMNKDDPEAAVHGKILDAIASPMIGDGRIENISKSAEAAS
mmetsp:Transcript_12881/g.31580  ORF Transcript_12881/g.31580 Transcript_12881/m.31580 type:complete len:760 (+) Transcript_12881:91-2370(+)|eukprot:CAMPEP_0114501634 /NCGR_PEP_ID=MMETSP0109-20121206/8600_1 /TAXON_ID=29199 /ORGANISM="Chlorarachnion reptans, Strain CCCM449" /LENGTH=759 /DNA_ID=CAMNT_0001679371 /DNA_START=12 /DNA_END=2291 /DNA_ORIENTATION=+